MIDTAKLNNALNKTRPFVALALLLVSLAAVCKAVAPALAAFWPIPAPSLSFLDLAALAAVLWGGLQATR